MIKFRALLVGLGQIGCGYDAGLPFILDEPYSSSRTLTHSRALACHPGFVLEAGIDASPNARNRFTDIYNVPAYPDLSTWRSSSSDQSPDLVVIAVPPELQPKLVTTLLDIIQPRLLLLEKPVAHNLHQAQILKDVFHKYPHISVAVNYIRRWVPAMELWRRRIQAGDLGRLLHGYLTYGKGLLCNGSHFVNLAEAWLGPLMMGRLLDDGLPFLGFDRELSVELLALKHLQAPLQVRSVGKAGLRTGELDLWFENGRLCWADQAQTIFFWPRCEPVGSDSHAPLAPNPEIMPTGLEHYQLKVVELLYRHLINPDESPLKCDFFDGLLTLETLSPAIKDDS